MIIKDDKVKNYIAAKLELKFGGTKFISNAYGHKHKK